MKRSVVALISLALLLLCVRGVQSEDSPATDFFVRGKDLCYCGIQHEEIGFDSFAANFHLEGELLYFMSDLSLVRYNMRSNTLTVVECEISSIAFIGDDIYFIEHASRDFSIYRQSLVTGERELVRGSGIGMDRVKDLSTVTWCDKLLVLHGELYYTTRCPARLFKYGEPDELIADFSDTCDGQLWSSHTDGRRIYCYYHNDGIAYVYVYDPAEGAGRLLTEAAG